MTMESGGPGGQAGATNQNDPTTRTASQYTPKGYSLVCDLQASFAHGEAAMAERLAAGDPSLSPGAEPGNQEVDAEPRGTEGQPRGYGDAATLYRAAGWLGVLPLPPRSKASPPPGHTGYKGEWPDDEAYAQWLAERPYDANLCLRLPETVIGIDVDGYHGRSGGQTLAEAEKRWGALPDAPTSSSRDDGVSGIRHYRVSAGTVLVDQIAFAELGLGHIELIQRHYRYSVAWPSVHPTTGQRYVWRLGGEIMAGPPSPDDLPELPDAWIDALKIDPHEAHRRSDSGDLSDVTGAMTGGQPSDKVAKRLSIALYDLEHGESRHDTVRGHILALLRYGSRGETGVQFALARLYERFVNLTGPDRKGSYAEAEKEFLKMVASADRLLGDEEFEPVDPFGTKARRREAAAACTAMGLDGAHNVFRKWLGDEYDADALDAVLAAAAVEQLDGDPLWLLLISGSGNAKTETVQALAGVGAIVTSTISSAGALLSGTPKREVADNATGGLLRRLQPNGTLVVKDVTSILSMSGDARAEVLAALREVHDGRWSRNVGTNGGMTLEWVGRIALVGAVTTAWDTHHGVVATMGDRFVLVRMDSTTGRLAAGRRAIANTGSEVQMRRELVEAVGGVIAGMDRSAVEVSDAETEALLAAADLVTLARTAVEYDRRGDIASAHSPEMPTRFAKQLAQVVRGAVAIGMPRDQALRLAVRCARDSVPPLRLAIIDDIAAHPSSTTTDVRKRLNKPHQTVDRQLQALHMLGVLGVVEKKHGDNRSRWFYSLSDGIDPEALRRQSIPNSAAYTSGINKRGA